MLSTIHEDDNSSLGSPSPNREQVLLPIDGRRQSISPNDGGVFRRRESTLLKPIGAFEPRVKPVTRERIRRQSEIIQQKIVDINIKSRKKIRNQLKDLEERQNKVRDEQLNFWIKKTSGSPFLKDYFAIDQQNAMRRNNFQKEKKRRKDQLQSLRDMTGYPKDDVCPKERISNLYGKISQEGILALTHRAMKLNAQKLEEEKIALDQKVDEEIYILEQKFPLLYDVTGSTSIHAGSQELLPSQILNKFKKTGY